MKQGRSRSLYLRYLSMLSAYLKHEYDTMRLSLFPVRLCAIPRRCTSGPKGVGRGSG